LADIFSSKVWFCTIRTIQKDDTFTSSNLEIKDVSTNFPVIIFNPGFYFGIAVLYSLIENLASTDI
jgi:hypothetical protein